MKRIDKDAGRQRWQGKLMAVVTSVLLMAFVLAGCSASNGNRDASGSFDGGAATESNSTAALMSDTKTSSQAASDKAADAATASGSPNKGTGASFNETGEDIQRKIVYKGNVTMEVEAYDEAQTALRNLIHLAGGYLLKFSDQKTATETGGAFTIKLPASGFDSFLGGLEKIKHLSYQSSAQGTDVTEEYVDMQARLKARQVVEARLLAFMEKATKTEDLLQISKQLGDVQTELEQIKGRIRYLDNNVAFSTIDLRMYQVTEAGEAVGHSKRGLGGRMEDAIKGSTKVLLDCMQGLIVFLAGAVPVLAIIIVIGVPVYAINRNGRRKREAVRAAVTAPPQVAGTRLPSETVETATVANADEARQSHSTDSTNSTDSMDK